MWIRILTRRIVCIFSSNIIDVDENNPLRTIEEDFGTRQEKKVEAP
jgi:hypothetical protein